MDDNSELTNIPDYQKIRQTSQTSGVQGSNTEWSEGLETLTPSPVVRQPTSPSDSPRQMQPSSSSSSSQKQPQQRQQQPQGGGYGNFLWEGGQGSNRSAATTIAGGSGVSKASWEAQGHYNASKYGLVHSNSGTSFSEASKASFVPQGFTRPVSKYVDSNGVERRVIGRSMSPAAHLNRHSYSESYFPAGGSSAGSEFSGLNNGDGGSGALKGSSSNLKGSLGKLDNWGSASNLVDKRVVEQHGSTPSRPLSQIGRYGSSHALLMHSNYRDDWGDVGGGGAGKKPQDDLRHWQQLHQEELLHQHLETQALYESPTSQAYQGQSLVDPLAAKLTLQEEAPARWEPVRRAADNIIREKNMIIDKLKHRILELEEDFKVSENKMRQTIMTNQDDVEIIQQKLQEVQHKNATLKERMNEDRSKKNEEIDNLELKLGACEHEIQQLKDSLRRKDGEMAGMRGQMHDLGLEAEAWKGKFDESRTTHQEMKRKLDSLQTYLNDLPTVEENRLKTEQILGLSEDNESLKSRVESYDKKLSQVRKVITARDFRIRELEEKEKEMETELAKLKDQVDQLRDSEGSELFKAQQALVTSGSDKERLAVDLEKAKKLLEATHFKLRQVEVKSQGEITAVQERLTQEEETVQYLRAEVVGKEEQMERMKKTIRDLGSQNQELLQVGLMAREQARLTEMTGSGGPEVVATQARFLAQLRLCYSELQALVEVCTKRAHGEDPDLSLLLGVKDPKYSDAEGGQQEGASGSQQDQVQTMAQWTSRLGELRKDVDKLRAHICNKYAEDMGDNINCATQ